MTGWLHAVWKGGSAEGVAWHEPLGFLAEVGLRSLLLLAVCGIFVALLRSGSARTRVTIWRICLLGLLLLPLGVAAEISWKLPLLPSQLPWRSLPTPATPAYSPAPHFPGVLPSTDQVVQVRSLHQPTPAESNSPWPLHPALFMGGVWLLGVAFLLLREAIGHRHLHRLARTALPAPEPATSVLASLWSQQLGDKDRPVRLLVSREVQVPVTWGFRQPIILLSPSCLGWGEAQLRAVLLHELAHVRSHDWLWSRFAGMIRALYWFHPAVWWAVARHRADTELASDDSVLLSGVPASVYATCLVEVVRMLKDPSSPVASPASAVSMARSRRTADRLHRILDPAVNRASGRGYRLGATLFAGVVVLVAGVRLTAADPGTKTAGEPRVEVRRAETERRSAEARRVSEEHRALAEHRMAEDRRRVAERRAAVSREIQQREADLKRLRVEQDRLRSLERGAGRVPNDRERALMEKERALAAKDQALRAVQMELDRTRMELNRARHELDRRNGLAERSPLELEEQLLRDRLQERQRTAEMERAMIQLEQSQRELLRATAQFEAGRLPIGERRRAEEALQRARVELDQARFNAETAKRHAERARAGQKTSAVDSDFSARLKAAEFDLSRAMIEMESAERAYADAQTRHKAGLTPIGEVEAAEARLREARAQLDYRRGVIEELARTLKAREMNRNEGKERSDNPSPTPMVSDSVPILGDLPILGRLFRKSEK